MGKQICFFQKNFLDLDNDAAIVTASEGDEFVKYIRTRSLRTPWQTTGSLDANDTIIEFDIANMFEIDRIFIVDHNLKNYKIEVFDDDLNDYQVIFSISDDNQTTTEIAFESFFGQKFRLTIFGTQIADSDKQINRLIVTKKIGQFSHWPKITNPVLAKGKNQRPTLSGKIALLKSVGAFSCRLEIDNWKNADDLALIELLYRQVEGFEVWLSGGDENQFYYAAESYRKSDFFLMSPVNDFVPEFVEGIYRNGFKIEIDLAEVIS